MLCMDGGGAKGVIEATILDKIFITVAASLKVSYTNYKICLLLECVVCIMYISRIYLQNYYSLSIQAIIRCSQNEIP